MTEPNSTPWIVVIEDLDPEVAEQTFVADAPNRVRLVSDQAGNVVLRLPKAALAHLGVTVGDQLEVTVRDDALYLAPRLATPRGS